MPTQKRYFTQRRPPKMCGTLHQVELDQVSQFMSQDLTWPQSRTGLNELADRVARLLAVQSVLIVATLPQPLEGVRVANELNLTSVESEGLIQFLKSYAKKTSSDLYRVRRIQLTGGGRSSIQSITWVRFGLTRSTGSVEYGTLVLGTLKPIGVKEELALLVVAQRVCELARVSELEAELSLRSQFLSIASHELKTPLTAIYGILQLQTRMMKAGKELPPFQGQDRYENFLKMSIRQVERLNELIDGLLDVSRIQNGRFVVEPIETDVARLFVDCIQNRLQVISQEAGMSLNIEAPDSLVTWVDPIRWEELITNLVMNAIRFSPEGGVVWVKLRPEGGGFRLTVRDQGPSVPEVDRERIFQPFERAQRTSRFGGLGLGLFISRQIAQLHGGSVNLIESIPGKGNVFEAYFPMRNPRALSLA